jgi:YD repeat-containing protein
MEEPGRALGLDEDGGSIGGFTHVSVGGRDLEESARFYGELFGLEEVPHPDFPFPVRWLRVGGLQLHLFQSDQPPVSGQHFGIEADDFGAVYEGAGRMGVRVKEGYFSNLYELPDGAVQMYVRNPSGNLVEVNWPDAKTLDREAIPEEIHKVEGGPDAALYMERREG